MTAYGYAYYGYCLSQLYIQYWQSGTVRRGPCENRSVRTASIARATRRLNNIIGVEFKASGTVVLLYTMTK